MESYFVKYIYTVAFKDPDLVVKRVAHLKLVLKHHVFNIHHDFFLLKVIEYQYEPKWIPESKHPLGSSGLLMHGHAHDITHSSAPVMVPLYDLLE